MSNQNIYDNQDFLTAIIHYGVVMITTTIYWNSLQWRICCQI